MTYQSSPNSKHPFSTQPTLSGQDQLKWNRVFRFFSPKTPILARHSLTIKNYQNKRKNEYENRRPSFQINCKTHHQSWHKTKEKLQSRRISIRTKIQTNWISKRQKKIIFILSVLSVTNIKNGTDRVSIEENADSTPDPKYNKKIFLQDSIKSSTSCNKFLI